MRGLLYKELRSLLPFLALAIIIPILGVCHELVTDIPYMRPLGATVDEYTIGSKESSAFVLIIIFAMASGLLVREYDEGTMEFLDALPLSRSRVFFAKISVCLLVPLALIVLDIGTSVLLHAFSRNSLDPGFHPKFLATAFVLRACQATVFLSLGLALSFQRRFGWLIMGLMFWTYLLVDEFWPSIRLFNLFEITRHNMAGQRWIIPYRQLAAQMTLAGVLLLLAYALFLGAGDRLVRGYQRIQRNRLGRVFLLCGGVMIVVVGFALGYELFQKDRDFREEMGEVVYPTWSASRTWTEHYEFLYPNNLAGRAQKVITGAEAAHGKVQSFLGVEPQDRILADMTGTLERHAGQAYWERIQMDLTVSESEATLQAILAHETTHVYLDQLSDSRLSDHFNSARFFHEGVASYVEYRFFRPEREIDDLWSVAAVMRARKQVDFGELVDDDRLRARHDADLVYPLGEVFVEALVHHYGPQSVGKIARSLARDDAPEDLFGQELWRDAFQACSYNLELVLDRFYARLDEEAARHRELIETLPRVKGAVYLEEDLVVVEAIWEPVDGWSTVCRFRQTEDAPARRYRTGFSDEHDIFYINRDWFLDGTCWYQLGLRDADRVICEPWLKVRLSR